MNGLAYPHSSRLDALIAETVELCLDPADSLCYRQVIGVTTRDGQIFRTRAGCYMTFGKGKWMSFIIAHESPHAVKIWLH